MLKKLLYLYNDGHNPFPPMKGQGFGFLPDPNHPDRMELQYFADDQMTQEEADRLNGIIPEMEEEYEAKTGYLAEIEKLYPERFIPTVPTKQEYDIDKYIEEYEDEHPYYNDDELDDINDKIYELITQGKKTLGSEYKSVKEFDKKNDILYSELETNRSNFSEYKSELHKLQSKYIKTNNIDMSLAHETIRYNDIYIPVITKITKNFINLNNNNELNNEKIKNEISKYVKIMKTSYENLIYGFAYGFLQMSKINKIKEVSESFREITGLLLLSQSKDSDKSNTLTNDLNKLRIEYTENRDIYKKQEAKAVEINIINEKIESLRTQYAEKKKMLDQKIRLSKIKQIQLTDPEQALKDALELNAELKEKETLATDKKLSKSAQKKANAVVKKASAEKQAETHIVNALSSLSSKGTYGKKLEDFFASNGQPILQKFTGDTSKIKDIEKDDVIPDEIVTFNDGAQNSLRKACTLDLYNNKFVFEIKNYVNRSINDPVIPMQPSKFAGTEYFKPRYLEDGSLYSLNLNYTSPKTGKHHTQNVLPPNTNGREVVFVIRLKEGLYQYKPFLDHKNTSIIPTGETTQDGRPLYFFESTKLKKCLDYNEKSAFNLKGHLIQI